MSILTANYEDKTINIDNYEHNIMKGNIICKVCKNLMIAKKGDILVHHFSHKSDISNCIMNSINKGEWHKMWQNFCIPENTEVIKNKDENTFIADIYNPNSTYTIELQDSYLEKSKIKDRELFYDKMMWIINLRNKNIDMYLEDDYSNKKYIFIKCYNKYFIFCKKPVYFDTNYGLYKKKKLLNNGYYLCVKLKTKSFFNIYFSNILSNSVDDIIKKLNYNDYDEDDKYETGRIKQFKKFYYIEIYEQNDIGFMEYCNENNTTRMNRLQNNNFQYIKSGGYWIYPIEIIETEKDDKLTRFIGSKTFYVKDILKMNGCIWDGDNWIYKNLSNEIENLILEECNSFLYEKHPSYDDILRKEKIHVRVTRSYKKISSEKYDNNDYILSGNTYKYKDKLKELGSNWDSASRGWKVDKNILDIFVKIIYRTNNHLSTVSNT